MHSISNTGMHTKRSSTNNKRNALLNTKQANSKMRNAQQDAVPQVTWGGTGVMDLFLTWQRY